MAADRFREEQEKVWNGWLIEELIGEGSYGKVYKVSRTEHGHKYFSAVKIISIPSKDQYKDAVNTIGRDQDSLRNYFIDMIDEIIGEVNILYSLAGHTNILGYFDHKIIDHGDEVSWDVLIRMEYVKSLRKHLMEKQMSRGDVVNLGIDICNALELCSKKGIVHRDIKEENIFVNNEGSFKLGDFGIAKIAQGRSMASLRGTPLYMAPEIYKGDKYDARIDIYSLGLVLYKLLNNNRMPFLPDYPNPVRFKDNETAMAKRMSGETLPMPLKARGRLGEIILKACDVDPDNRYNSAQELRKQLLGELNSMEEKFKNELITPAAEKETQKRTDSAADKTERIANNINQKTEVISGDEGPPEKTETIRVKPVYKDAPGKRPKKLTKGIIAAISACGAILIAGIVMIVLWQTGVIFDNNPAEETEMSQITKIPKKTEMLQATETPLTEELQEFIHRLSSEQWMYLGSSPGYIHIPDNPYEHFIAFGSEGLEFFDNMELRGFSLDSGEVAYNMFKEYEVENFDGKDTAYVFIDEYNHNGIKYNVYADHIIDEDGNLIEYIIIHEPDSPDIIMVSNFNIFVPLSEYGPEQMFTTKLCSSKWVYQSTVNRELGILDTIYEDAASDDGYNMREFYPYGEGNAVVEDYSSGEALAEIPFYYEISELEGSYFAYIQLEDYEMDGKVYSVFDDYFLHDDGSLHECIYLYDEEADDYLLASPVLVYMPQESEGSENELSQKDEISFDLYLQTDSEVIEDGEMVDFWIDATNDGTRTIELVEFWYDGVYNDLGKIIAPGETARIDFSRKTGFNESFQARFHIYIDEENDLWESTDIIHFTDSGRKYYPREIGIQDVTCYAFMEPDRWSFQKGEQVEFSILISNYGETVFDEIEVLELGENDECSTEGLTISPGEEKEIKVYTRMDFDSSVLLWYMLRIHPEDGEDFWVYTNTVFLIADE